MRYLLLVALAGCVTASPSIQKKSGNMRMVGQGSYCSVYAFVDTASEDTTVHYMAEAAIYGTEGGGAACALSP